MWVIRWFGDASSVGDPELKGDREEKTAQASQGFWVKSRFYLLGGLALVLGGVYTLWSMGVLSDLYHEYRDLIELFTDRNRLRAMVLSYGNLAPLAFVVMQVTQVVISFIPGEATGFLGGFIFGAFRGFLYSSFGLSLGSLLAFGLARWLGLRFVRRIVRPGLYRRFAFLREPRGILAVFLLFLIPGFPKDTLSFILGVTPIPLWSFFIVMSVGVCQGPGSCQFREPSFTQGSITVWSSSSSSAAFCC